MIKTNGERIQDSPHIRNLCFIDHLSDCPSLYVMILTIKRTIIVPLVCERTLHLIRYSEVPIIPLH